MLKITPPSNKLKIEGTKQEIFDAVVEGLRKQGWKRASGFDGCRYRVQKGGEILKCAVGQLIPDDHYSVCLDKDGFEYGNRIGLFIDSTEENIKFLREMQMTHDNANGNGEILKAAMNGFAFGAGLDATNVY